MEIETLADSIRRKVAEVQAEQAAALAAEKDSPSAIASDVESAESRVDSAAGRTLKTQLKQSTSDARKSLKGPIFTAIVLMALAILIFSLVRSKAGF